MKVTIYSDGSARGNPDGPGGYGTVIQYVDKNGILHEKAWFKDILFTLMMLRKEI